MSTSPKPVAKKATAPKVAAVPKAKVAPVEAKPPTKAELAAAAKVEKEAAAAQAKLDKETAAAKEAAKAEKAKAAAERKATAQAAKTERETKRAEVKARVGALRKQGYKWPEVASELGISIAKAQWLGQVFDAEEAGPVKVGTPALVKNDRDVKLMGWDQIAVQYGLSKSGAQKLYAEAGGDPHKSYVGRGGRYFSHETDVASQRAKFAAEAHPPKEKGQPKEKAAGKPLFTEETSKEDVIAKIGGKTITTVSGKEFSLKPEAPIKVGAEAKTGVRVVQFTNRKNGGTTTVKLLDIIKAVK